MLFQFEKIQGQIKNILIADKHQETDNVHDLRVSLRRVMTLLDNFSPWLDAGWVRQYKKGCRKLLRLLGKIRDLDVLSERAGTLAPADSAALSDLQGRLAADMRRLNRRLPKLLSGQDLQKRLIRRIDGLKTPGSLEQAARPPAPGKDGRQTCLLGDCLPAILYLAAAKVTVYRDFSRDGDKTMHQLRIAAKGFRYTIEAFGPLLGEQGARLADEFKDFQDLLGNWHDVVVALRYLGNYKESGHLADQVQTWQEAWENELAALQEAFRQRWPQMQTAWFHSHLADCLDSAYKT